MRKVYDDFEGAKQIFEDAKAIDIIFPDEGSYQFILENRAILTVYASPWKSSLGDWGFRYPSGQEHEFEIMKGVDLGITHKNRNWRKQRVIGGDGVMLSATIQEMHAIQGTEEHPLQLPDAPACPNPAPHHPPSCPRRH